jgi:hypothetical protein
MTNINIQNATFLPFNFVDWFVTYHNMYGMVWYGATGMPYHVHVQQLWPMF